MEIVDQIVGLRAALDVRASAICVEVLLEAKLVTLMILQIWPVGAPGSDKGAKGVELDNVRVFHIAIERSLCRKLDEIVFLGLYRCLVAGLKSFLESWVILPLAVVGCR